MAKRTTVGTEIVHAICGIVFFVALTLANVPAWSQLDEGQALFEVRCAACHDLPNPAEPPPEGWSEQLELMAPLARLKPPQQQDVLAYLLEHTQQSVNMAALEEDRSFFEEKCSRCHSLERIFLEPLTDESRRHVVARMQARSGTDWLSDEDVGRVLNYLAVATPEIRPPEPLSADASASDIFEARCTGCHTLERIFTRSVDSQDGGLAWDHVVGRMRGKAPQWMTDTEAQRILEYLQDTISVPTG